MKKKVTIVKRFKRRQREKRRALYVRLPHTIHKQEDVAKLFTGNFKVNLLRQSRRYCYVIFADEKERLKNLKAARNITLNGKRVIVAPAIINTKKRRIFVNKKKIVIPEVKPDIKITKHLFISNIRCETKRDELMGAMPGCLSAKMLKSYAKNFKAAIVKMESVRAAAEYLTMEREWPTIKGHKLRIKCDTRKRHKRKTLKPLKIYN